MNAHQLVECRRAKGSRLLAPTVSLTILRYLSILMGSGFLNNVGNFRNKSLL